MHEEHTYKLIYEKDLAFVQEHVYVELSLFAYSE